MTGLYIAIDGGDGTGKGTLVRNLLAKFPDKRWYGREIVTTHQPGGTPLAEKIREAILAPEARQSDALTQLLLHFAARRDNIETVVRPALIRGAIVLTDRCEASTYAYQIMGQYDQDTQGVARGQFARLCEAVLAGVEPDCYLFLEADPVVAKKRRLEAKGQEVPNHFDLRDIEFFKRVAYGYRAFAKVCAGSRPAHFLDANKPAEQVLEDALAVLDPFVERRVDLL